MIMAKEDKDLVGLPLPRKEFYLCSPEAIGHVLVGNRDNYVKDHWAYQRISLAMGLGILTSDGDRWRNHRKIIQPLFHRDHFEHYTKIIQETTFEAIQKWENHTQFWLRRPVEIRKVLTEITLGVILKLFLSGEGLDQLSLIMKTVKASNDYITHTPTTLKYWPSPSNIKFQYYIRQFDALLLDLIKKRRAASQPKDDLLSALIQGELSDNDILAELKTIVIAGHETIETAITWTHYLIASHPQVKKRLFHEVDTVLKGKPVTHADLPDLIYTKMLFQETIRIRPVIWAIRRRALRRDIVCGYQLPRDAEIVISIYALHHDPDLWPEPYRFKPDRFAPHLAANRKKYSYIPFGAGPRSCIGGEFSTMEAMTIIATIAQQYDMHVPLGAKPVRMEPLVTLAPKDKIKLRLSKRKDKAYRQE